MARSYSKTTLLLLLWELQDWEGPLLPVAERSSVRNNHKLGPLVLSYTLVPNNLHAVIFRTVADGLLKWLTIYNWTKNEKKSHNQKKKKIKLLEEALLLFAGFVGW